MSKKVIAVDQDYVLAKLIEKWLKTYNVIFEDNLKPEDITEWNISKFVKEEARPYMNNILNLDKFYRDLDVVEDSQRVLEKLSKKYEIIIVTDPYTRMSFKSKYEWLQEKFPFIHPKNFVFTGNKSIINADYLIDDGFHNLEGFKGYGLLFDAPYNREETRFFRVMNWLDIENLFDRRIDEVEKFYEKKGGK